MNKVTNENTGSQAAEVYLYGLSEDGGKSFTAFKDMCLGDDTSYWAFGVKVQGHEWIPVCPIARALAAPKMREALEAFLDYPKKPPGEIVGNDPNGHPINAEGKARWLAREALAACGPDYVPSRTLPGTWERQGFTFYTLMHHGWRRGVEKFKNRVWFQLNFDASVPEEERESIAASLTRATPDPRDEEIKRLREALEYANKSLINAGFHGGSAVILDALRGEA